VEGGTHICGDCLSRKREFTNTAIFEYDALCREVIHRFKYSSKPRYAFGLAELMIYFGAKDLFKGIDALAPVPMYVKKKNKRGYNQAEELAKALSIGCGVPVVTDFLIRTRNTAPQNKLPPERRASNLIDAFALKDKRSLESVLLIDDIYTTGETLSACGTVMKAGGVSRVSSLTLSITVKEAEDF
jgi:ComF family protein